MVTLLRKAFDLLRNAPHSSIDIHFGVTLLVLAASLPSSAQKDGQTVNGGFFVYPLILRIY